MMQTRSLLFGGSAFRHLARARTNPSALPLASTPTPATNAMTITSRSMSTRQSQAASKTPSRPPLPLHTIRLRDFPQTTKSSQSSQTSSAEAAASSPPPTHLIPITLQTASQSEIIQHRINIAIRTFQSHLTDSGSPSVQIAVATERILNMARHCATFRKDKHSNRGFQMMVSRRKKMMAYLKRTDLAKFKQVVSLLHLEKEASHL